MNDKLKKILIICVGLLAIGSIGFMIIISPISRSKDRKLPEANGETSEILGGVVVEQNFINTTDNIQEIAIVFNRAYYLDDTANMIIELLDGNNVLTSTSINADSIEGNHRTYLKPENLLKGYVGKELTLKVYTTSSAGTGLSLMTNKDENTSFKFGGEEIQGTICFSVTGK